MLIMPQSVAPVVDVFVLFFGQKWGYIVFLCFECQIHCHKQAFAILVSGDTFVRRRGTAGQIELSKSYTHTWTEFPHTSPRVHFRFIAHRTVAENTNKFPLTCIATHMRTKQQR